MPHQWTRSISASVRAGNGQTMGVTFDRNKYFDMVRESLFFGTMDQGQVDGQEAILSLWEASPLGDDLRWLAYCLSTTIYETASTMLPISEYGHGEGMEYGQPDPETGQTYYGRGYVQLTWRDNYAKATHELELDGDDDLEWHADRALDPIIAAEIMFQGMSEGWFRSDENGPQTLDRYFNKTDDDVYGAREIINGDKHIVPDWSGGVSIGNLIAGYHREFLDALKASAIYGPVPEPPAPEVIEILVEVHVDAPPGVHVTVRQI
jgi:putative chitinase